MPAAQYIDLSHTIDGELITYQGLPAPLICDFLRREDSRAFYAEDTTFHIGRIELVGNTGTYLDCPFHRFADGADTAGVTLDQLADLPGLCIRVPATMMAIGPEVFAGLPLQGKAVLVNTGWSRYWRTDPYFSGHPFVTEAAALFLRDSGIKLLGIDGYNVDDTHSRARPVHTILLGAGILIAEHLCALEVLPESGFTFTAVPPKIVGMGTFPVRAFAKIN
ncbi:MAG: cyclase family protein [Lewinellaceae bacterium]|nr:cyclase family protein [Lewinellaceae bacterium]